ERDPPPLRLEPEEPAVGGRDPDRAGAVRGGRRSDEPPRDGRPASPARAAGPLPPAGPPGGRSRLHGLRVAPHVSDSVKPKIASSGRFVFPIGTAPARRSRLTSSESASAGRSNPPVPKVVTSPSTSLTSLIATGTPSSCASSPAARLRSASSASDRAGPPPPPRNELSCGSRRHIRSRQIWTSS